MAEAPELDFLDFESVQTISQSLQTYVLEWESGGDLDGRRESVVVAVMKRSGGLLLALPASFLTEEELSEADSGDHVLGPSVVLTVSGVVMVDDQESPIGVDAEVLVVDADQEICRFMRPFQRSGESIAECFYPDDPFAFPSSGELVAKTMGWLQSFNQPQEGDWYANEVTAESTPQTPTASTTKPRRQRAPPGGATGSEKPKRVTTASLANSIQAVLDTLPVFSNQIQSLVDRQTKLEEQVGKGSTVASQLSKPLTASLVKTPAKSVAEVASMMRPPPKVQAPLLPVPSRDAVPAPVLELQQEKPQEEGQSSEIARAMMAQSMAITSLVAQIAGSSSDPMQDLQSSTSGTRGALGRAKLQGELAQQKGTFFHSVVLAMARRMAPTAVADQPYGQLMASGITGTRYLERFGGYGKQRDLGLIQFQLMTVFDFLMAENTEAAKDTLALLIVMVEQACLDHGRFDLGQVLTLQEDPPAGVFTNRQLSQVSRARSFAPLADQRWITVALAFLKELDTITVKRTELLSTASASTGGGDPSTSEKGRGRGNPKRKSRGGGRGGGQQQQEEET